MRVLMLGWEFPPHISGGLGTACHGITRGLASHGVDVLFVVPKEHGDEDGGAARVLGCDRLLARAEERGESFPQFRLFPVASPLRPYQTHASYAQRLAELRSSASGLTGGYGTHLSDEVVRYAQAMLELARSETFDVIHAHDWMTFPAGLALKRISRKPLVCHVHSCEADRNPTAPDASIEYIEQQGFSGSDRTVCVSRFTADRVSARYRIDSSKLRVVHNAVRIPERSQPAKKTFEGQVVLFLGRVTHQKGPETFLEAAARVLAVDPDVKFVMAGSGDLLGSMVEKAAHLGIARSVYFTGFLEGPDVDRMYAQADVYVMPSVSEPFGIGTLEALAAEVPVIVSRQSGVAEVLEHSVKVEPGDAAGLAGKILTLLQSPGLRRQLVQGARRELAQLSWEKSAEKLLGIYAELVA